MRDPRQTQLAKNLIRNAVNLQKGEKVWINMTAYDPAMVTALVEETYAVGGYPFVVLSDPKIERKLMQGMTEEQAKIMAELDKAKMEKMDAYIAIRNAENIFESVDVPQDISAMYNRVYSQPVHMETRLPKTKWVVLRYPSPSMAQQAQMSTEAFEDFYFSVCNLDYNKMSKAMDPLKALMEKTDKVHLKGPGTDLTFSIKGIGAMKCDGEKNIPDGEIYTAPVRDSVNGIITYNTPSMVQGFKYENVSFTFENGKIVNATANDTDRINHYLDTDEGARYIGEFAIGVNPNINNAICDILFDEKIAGSIHFTPGNSYDDVGNGNVSAIHWDLVLIQTPEYGGGEIWFDDVLIRKDGRFVLPELDCLNPENLLSKEE